MLHVTEACGALPGGRGAQGTVPVRAAMLVTEPSHVILSRNAHKGKGAS